MWAGIPQRHHSEIMITVEAGSFWVKHTKSYKNKFGVDLFCLTTNSRITRWINLYCLNTIFI